MNFQMSGASSKDLEFRSKQMAERLSESLTILDHDPSMALYRLQEHINKTLPALVSRRQQTAQLAANLHGACYDLDNAIGATEQMRRSLPIFERIQDTLKGALNKRHSDRRGGPVDK